MRKLIGHSARVAAAILIGSANVAFAQVDQAALRAQLMGADLLRLSETLSTLRAAGTLASPLAPDVAKLLSAKGEHIPNSAAITLAGMGKDALPYISTSLQANDPLTVKFAMEAAKRFAGDADLLLPNLGRLASNENPSISQTAIDALAELAPRNPKALPILQDKLEQILSLPKDKFDAIAVSKACSSAKALGRAGDPSPYLSTLQKAINSGPPDLAAVVAIYARAASGDKSSTDRLEELRRIRQVQDVGAATSLLTSDDLWVREAAARALRANALRARDAVPSLAQTILESRVSDTMTEDERAAALHARGAALYALRDIGPDAVKASIAAVLVATDDPHPWIRTIAIETLGTAGVSGKKYAPYIEPRLKDVDSRVSNAARRTQSILLNQ